MDKLKVELMTKEMVENVFEIEKTFFDISTSASILESFDNKNLFYFVLFFGDKIVGFLECKVLLDEAELYEIAIENDYQGKGFSLKLMDYFIEFCRSRNVRTIFLEVNIINSKAIGLYEKYGFEKYFIRKKYYGNNDAVLMRLQM